MRTSVSIMLFDLYSVMGAISYEALNIAFEDFRRIEEKNYYGTILRNNSPRVNPIPSVSIKDYLSRKYQDRKNYNHPTKICQRGLEKRLKNKEIKEVIKQRKAENERGIKEAFARKIKNKTYNKRHHSRNNNTY